MVAKHSEGGPRHYTSPEGPALIYKQEIPAEDEVIYETAKVSAPVNYPPPPPHPYNQPIAVDPVRKLLDERKGKYGPYTVTARIIQGLETVMRAAPQYPHMSDAQKESLHMIANKIGRILNGDYNHKDSWMDIAGYATLAVDCIEGKQ